MKKIKWFMALFMTIIMLFTSTGLEVLAINSLQDSVPEQTVTDVIYKKDISSIQSMNKMKNNDGASKKTIKVRVEGSDYTILPETEITVDQGAGNKEILEKLGLQADGSDAYLEAIEGDMGNFGWTVVDKRDKKVYVAQPMDNSIITEARTDQGKLKEEEEFTITIKDTEENPVKDATIAYYDSNKYNYTSKNENQVIPENTLHTTDRNGKAKIKFEKAGIYYVLAQIYDRRGKIINRSKAVKVVVEGKIAEDKEAPKIILEGIQDQEDAVRVRKDFKVIVQEGHAKTTVKFKGEVIQKNDADEYTIFLDNGENKITVEVEDNAGNITTKEITVYFKDTSKPQIHVQDICNNQVVEKDEVNFTVEVIDNIDKDIISTVKVNNTEIQPNKDGSYTAKLKEGKNEISIVAKDQAGNEGKENLTIVYHVKGNIDQLNIEILEPQEHRVGDHPLTIKVTDQKGNPVNGAQIASCRTYRFTLKDNFDNCVAGVTNADGMYTYCISRLHTGKYYIQARLGEIKSDIIDMNVDDPKYLIQVMSLEPMIAVGETKELSVEVKERYGYNHKKVDVPVIWQSSNEEIVTVNEKGILEGKKAGEATIYAKVANDPFYCDSIKVKVSDKVVTANIRIEQYSTEESIDIDKITILGNNLKFAGEEVSLIDVIKRAGEYSAIHYVPQFNEKGQMTRLREKWEEGKPIFSVLVNGKSIDCPRDCMVYDGDNIICSYNNATNILQVETEDRHIVNEDFYIYVKDQNGKPVQGAEILLRKRKADYNSNTTSLQNTTDHEGKVKLYLDQAQGYYIVAQKDGYIRSADKKINIVAQDVKVEYDKSVYNHEEFHIKVMQEGSPLENANIYWEPNEEIYGPDSEWIMQIGKTDENGEATSKIEAPEGNYTIVVKDNYENTIFTGTIQIKDKSSFKSKKIADLPQALSESTVVKIGQKLYLFGGKIQRDNEEIDSIYEFDPQNKEIKKIGKLPEAGVYNATAVDQDVYLFGNEKVYKWNIDGKVEQIGELPKNLLFTAKGAPIIGDKIYIYGRDWKISKVISFDIKTHKIQEEARRIVFYGNGEVGAGETDYAAVTQIDGKIYIIGGQYAHRDISNIFVFDPEQKNIKKIDMSHFKGIKYTQPIVADGKVYLLGGDDDTKESFRFRASYRIYEFNPKMQSIKSVGYLPREVYNCGVGFINGKAYIFGGRQWNHSKIMLETSKDVIEVSGFKNEEGIKAFILEGIPSDMNSDSQSLSISVKLLSGYEDAKMEVFLEEKEIQKDAKGSYTLDLKEGKNIVKVNAINKEGKILQEENFAIIYKKNSGGSGSSSGTKPDQKSVTVFMRIEGYDHTLLEKRKISVDLFDLNPYLGKATGSSATPSNGWGVDKFKRPTVAHAIVKALEEIRARYDLQDYGWGLYMAMIDGKRERDITSKSGWLYRVNGSIPNIGCQGYTLNNNDDIVWYFAAEGYDTYYTTLNADKTNVKTGEEITLTLDGFITDKDMLTNSNRKIDRAKIYVNKKEYTVDGKTIETDKNGRATISFDAPGTYEISAERSKYNGVKDIARPLPVKITVTGDAKAAAGGGPGGGGAPSVVKNQDYKKENDIVNDQKSNENEIVQAVKNASGKFNKNIEKEKDHKKILNDAKDVTNIFKKATERVENEKLVKEIASKNAEMIKILAKISEKFNQENQKEISKVGVDDIKINIKAMEQVKDRNEIAKIAKETIKAGSALFKAVGKENGQVLKENIQAVAKHAIEKVSIQKIEKGEIKLEKNQAIAQISTTSIENTAKNVCDMVKEIKGVFFENQIQTNKPLPQTIIISLPKIEQNKIQVNLPKTILDTLKANNLQKAVIKTDTAIFEIQKDTFKEKVEDTIILQAEKIDKKGLTALAQKQVEGQIKVIDLTALIGDIPIKEFKVPIKVAIPYEGQVDQREKVEAFYLKDDGSIENMGGEYNPNTKMVTFETTHFSKYFAKKVQKYTSDTHGVFQDLNGYEWAKGAIEEMANKGIIKGRSEGIFDPSASITRAEFATLITKMLEFKIEDIDVSFKDVEDTVWYTPYIKTAYKNGLISGRSETIFDPNGKITREEMATIIGKVLIQKGEGKANTNELERFSDKMDIAPWANENVALCVKEKIISGMPDNTFMPKENANRAQAAMMLNNLYNSIK